MFSFMQKWLEYSIRLEKSSGRIVRILGKILGIVPVLYAEIMHKKLMDGSWDPSKHRKRRMHRKKRRK